LIHCPAGVEISHHAVTSDLILINHAVMTGVGPCRNNLPLQCGWGSTHNRCHQRSLAPNTHRSLAMPH